jgi:flavin reductase ActVB
MTATSRLDVQPATYRQAMRKLATGVTVVTTVDANGSWFGFTASSFIPVSMEPPLVLVCIDRSALSFDTFRSCTHFVVSILADGHQNVAERFSRRLADKFAAGDVVTTPDGMPAVDGALSVFECESTGRQQAGDHMILIGRVYRLETAPGHPMVYFDRGFRRLERPIRGADTDRSPTEIAS